MKKRLTRREVMKTIALTAGVACAGVPKAFGKSLPPGKIKIGHTCITWGTFPLKPGTHDHTLDLALKDISTEGFWNFETFIDDIVDWDERGQLQPLIEQYGVPLLSAYTAVDVLNPANRQSEIERLKQQCQIVKKYHGSYIVLQVNHIDPGTYNFKEHRDDIISGLNDYAAVITDLGLQCGLHQHTSTAVEHRDEVYSVMGAVNTKNLKFAPDVGQLQKGGADAVQVVKDFLPLVTHMHLKDYKGWQWYEGYCPLGMGVVDVPAILNMMEKHGLETGVMVELDPSKDGPMTPLETEKISKAYLEKRDFKFRS
jgi:inosose dehydratase